MALIQARLQVLDTQSAGSSEQLDDDVSDCLDEFSEKLEELLQLSSAFSQGWQQEQELIQGKSKTLQMFSQEAQDSWLLVLSSINLLEYHAESLSNASKNRHFQLIRAGSRNLNRLLEDLLILSECQNVKSYGDCSMANAPVGLRVKKA